MSLTYRRDSRDQQKFREDIEAASDAESWIMQEFLNLLMAEFGLCLGARPADHQDGEIRDTVEADPDFTLQAKPLEVKAQHPKQDDFNIKRNQIESYSDDTQILFVNGLGTDDPEFAVFSPGRVREAGDKATFWDKPVYRCEVDDFNFRPFKAAPPEVRSQ